ncbi:MAG: hypothetical protein ABIH56_06740 [Candidatus Margulisiibacteriota bacterium]
MRLKLGLISIFFLVSNACAAPEIYIDHSGNLLQSWLEGKNIKLARSLDLGSSFSQPITLSFSAEAFDLAADQTALKYYLIHQTSKEVFLSKTSGNNFNFSETRSLSKTGKNPKILASGGNLFAAWQKNDSICLASSNDQGETWLEPELITPTGETIGRLALASDGQNGCDLVFSTSSKYPDRYRLFLYSAKNRSLIKITEGFDPIVLARIAPGPFGPLIVWQQQYLGRREAFAAVSLNGGKSFSQPKKLDLPEQPARLAWDGEKWRGFIIGPETPPGLVSWKVLVPVPASNAELTMQPASTNSSLEIIAISKPVPSVWTLEISPDPEFFPLKTRSMLVAAAAGILKQTITLPGDLPDGKYYARLAVNDGLAAFTIDKIASFTLDRTAPVIIVASSAETIDNNYRLQGTVNEPGTFTINGQTIPVRSSGTFESRQALKPGVNFFLLTATDEAGNTTKNSLTINCAIPTTLQLKLIKPAETDWLKPGSIIYCEIQVTDPTNELVDETEATVKINGESLNETLYYDQAEQSLSGLITLPNKTSDGGAQMTVKLPKTEKQLSLNIDATPPTLTVTGGATVFGRFPFEFPLPLSDNGSGLDPAGTIVMVNGTSCETFSSSEASLKARITLPLSDGTYEVTVKPRDRVGNTSPQSTFWYCQDTIVPKLVIEATPEVTERQTIVINGAISDRNLQKVMITSNGKEIYSFFPSQTFSKEVPIVPGNNTIVIEGLDLAGNSAAQTISFSSAIHSSGVLLSDVGNAPNPFSPRLDGQTYFICRLSAGFSLPADIRLYIFNLTGELVWKKEFPSSNTNIFAWNGRDHFGGQVANGVYLYTIGISSGGRSELMRGKLIVYQ